MPRFDQLPDWTGRDAYLIGGGPSLQTFDFERLRGRPTIGCNQAFLLGAERCQICAFGDLKFWKKFKVDLESYEGWVVTNYGVMRPPTWLHRWTRQDDGLSGHRGTLGWNFNTGAAAINLALLLGAQRVFLLGYDLGQTPEAHHWHDHAIEAPSPPVFARFAEGFQRVAKALPSVFPGRQVINLGAGTSSLTAFPVEGRDQHFALSLKESLCRLNEGATCQ